jgi:hypothetical protein
MDDCHSYHKFEKKDTRVSFLKNIYWKFYDFFEKTLANFLKLTLKILNFPTFVCKKWLFFPKRHLLEIRIANQVVLFLGWIFHNLAKEIRKHVKGSFGGGGGESWSSHIMRKKKSKLAIFEELGSNNVTKL